MRAVEDRRDGLSGEKPASRFCGARGGLLCGPVSIQHDLNDLVSILYDLRGSVSIQWVLCGPMSIQHDRFGSMSVQRGLCGPLSIQHGLFGAACIQHGLCGCVYIQWDLCGHVSIRHDPCGPVSLGDGTGPPCLSSPVQGLGGCRLSAGAASLLPLLLLLPWGPAGVLPDLTSEKPSWLFLPLSVLAGKA